MFGGVFGIVVRLGLEVHEFLLEFSDLLLVQFYFIPDLANQMGIESLQYIRDILHLLETALLTVKFFDFILQSDYFLFHFFLLTQVSLSELYKLAIFSGQLVCFIIELWEFLEDFVFFHFEDFSGKCSLYFFS